MSRKILIDAAHVEETRVAVVQNNQLIDFDIENNAKKTLKGNIYLAKIIRVEPSLQAAFVDYGGNRHGFLAFTEIHPDYFRIPVADREKLGQPVDENVKKFSAVGDDEGVDSADLPDETATDIEDDINAEAETSDEGDEDGGASELEEILNASNEGADNTDDDTEEAAEKPKETNPYKLYKIQEVIKSRQIVLVQVVKEERGNKGAALTTFISLAGRYCVLMPNAQHGGGVSRRITDTGDRRRLKSIMSDLKVAEGSSLIVRTAGLDRSKTEIKRDYGYLTKLWQEICAETVTSTAPSLIYEEADIIRRTIRDIYSKDISEIFVEGNEGYKHAKKYMKAMVPSHAKKVQPYKDEKCPLFFKYKIEQQIEQMYSPTVKLKSGGYIVINQTEALVAIDVNSGRATRERHIDNTALNTNLEAAEEVARQIRLRDYAGLVVIDFIDMNDSRNNHLVEKKLRESLAMDRARVQAGRISQFGLLEMSRQRLRPSIMEASTVKCDSCGGSGVVRSVESVGLQLLRVIEETCLNKKCGRSITVHMPAHVAFYLLSAKRHEISDLEQRFQLRLNLKEDNRLINTGFKIEGETGNFIADGLGNSGQPETGDKDQGSKSKKKDKNNNSQPAQKEDNKKRSGKGKEETNQQKGDHKPELSGDSNNRKKRKGSGRKNRQRNRKPSGTSQTGVADAKGDKQDNKEAAPAADEKKQDVRQPERKKSAPSSVPVNTDQAPAPAEKKAKSASKKGWWQKLLD